MEASSDIDDRRTTSSVSDDLTESSYGIYTNRTIHDGLPTLEEDPPPPHKFVVCKSCSRTFRESLIDKHLEEYHTALKCDQCGSMIDQYHLRKHQEQECPRRFCICPHCYVHVEDMRMDRHLKSCPPPAQLCQIKDKVCPNKGLSFKGTIFHEHTRIAESFINIARGYPEKPPYNLLVKAESKSKVAVLPTLKDLVDVLGPSSPCNVERTEADLGRDAFLLNQVAAPLQKAFARDRRRKERAVRKMKRRKSRKLRKAAAAGEDNDDDDVLGNNLKPPQPPAQSKRVRQVHQSVAQQLRAESYRRRFVRSWLGSSFVDQDELNEMHLKLEERIEDAIINEAIQLEMQKDTLKRIPRDRWPSFVEEMKRRRSKWKDLGFSIEDSAAPVLEDGKSDDDGDEAGDNKPLELGKVEIVEEDPSTEMPYWKLVEVNLDQGRMGTEDATALVGSLYKPCQSCHQLFHEDLLDQHTAACKEQKERLSRKVKQQQMNNSGSWSTRKTVSTPNCCKVSHCTALSIPPPVTGREHCSSLALSVAPHSKYYRWGKILRPVIIIWSGHDESICSVLIPHNLPVHWVSHWSFDPSPHTSIAGLIL